MRQRGYSLDQEALELSLLPCHCPPVRQGLDRAGAQSKRILRGNVGPSSVEGGWTCQSGEASTRTQRHERDWHTQGRQVGGTESGMQKEKRGPKGRRG